ncbi:BTAD domain-containing putative transcriptional regulator [Terrabacter ginsenosidimutans]|uniref:BTAD domain-containing putative transcriptional regulator n=1 Tax=Terrabacter ginsenosidimutans TaxID=490575 RepID=A0ABP7DT43_9MICO
MAGDRRVTAWCALAPEVGFNGPVQFRVLGPVEALDDDGAPIRLGSGRERLVLALLLVGADRLVPTEQLIDSLWNDPPPTARQQLQNLIAGLRRRLAAHDPTLVTTRPFGYELRMTRHRLDLADFRSLCTQARAQRAAGDEDTARTAARAVELWRGAPLSDAAPASSDTGTEALIQGLSEERIAAVELLLESLASGGHHEEVLSAASQHLQADPWNERLHEHHIRALAATGRRQEASDTYRQVRRQFLDELGVEPGRSLRELNTQILGGSPLAPARPRPRIVPRELPAMTWTLVGRDAILDSVTTQLTPCREEAPTSGPPSIVVLAGVGGVGKTALAVAAAHQLADAFPDGTLHASLGAGPSGVADGHEVLGRFLRALGVEHAAIPADPDERVALYRSTVDRKRVLVVLDDASSEAQVRRLLPTSPGSAAVVTSRSKLAGLPGVHRHTIPPLLPEDATSMLAELSGTQHDDLGVLAQIGTLCGHLPLALCVAAAKLATNEHLLLEDLRDRLSDEHARLDELSVGDIDVRASITTSVTDLSPAAGVLFRRLALAPSGDWPGWVAALLLGGGPTTSGSASGVQGHDASRPGGARQGADARALDELIDRHLVEPTGRDTAGQPRFRVHSLVLELAGEAMEDAEPSTDADALAIELARRWLGLADIADARLDPGGDPVDNGAEAGAAAGPAARAASTVPADWFESERLNLVGAVHAAVARDDRELAARLALSIRTFLTIRAYDDERERVLRIALDDYPDDADQRLAAQLLAALFGVLAQGHRHDELTDVASRFLDAARRVGDAPLEQRALSQLGWAAMVRRDFAASLGWYEQAAELAVARDDRAARTTADAHRGVLLRNMGRPGEGDPLLAAMVTESRRQGSRRATCIWLVTRAEGLIDLDRFAEAEVLLTEALTLAREVRDDLGEAHCQLTLARTHLGHDDLVGADAAYEAARAGLDAHSRSGEDPDGLRLRVDLDTAAGRWGEAHTRARRLVAARRAAGDDLELACDLAREAACVEHLGLDAGSAEAASRPGHGNPAAAECRAILGRLDLPLGALRLPPHLRQ